MLAAAMRESGQGRGEGDRPHPNTTATKGPVERGGRGGGVQWKKRRRKDG